MVLSNSDTAVTVVETIPARGARKGNATINLENTNHIIQRLTKLYTRPVEATVREVVSNAIDAMAKLPLGDRRPVEITSPTLESPFFTVRDYGCGMTAFEAEHNYIAFGGGSKGDDLAFVGSFGLGGKAPLAYTSTFYVETVKAGVKTEFSMSLIDGVVSFSMKPSVKTDEADGTFVKVPVNNYDVERFKSAIQLNYKQFSCFTPFVIDGKLYQGTDELFELGELPIHKDPETGEIIMGRVFMDIDAVASALMRQSLRYKLEAVLSGWSYSVPNSGYARQTFYVEIPTGLYNFDSSRDSITDDSRARVALNLLMSTLNDKEKLANLVLGAIPKLDKTMVLKLAQTKALEHYELDEAGIFGFMGTDIKVSEFDQPDGFNIAKALSSKEVIANSSFIIGRKGELHENPFDGVNHYSKTGIASLVSGIELGKIHLKHLIYLQGANQAVFLAYNEANLKSILRKRNYMLEHFGKQSTFFLINEAGEQVSEDVKAGVEYVTGKPYKPLTFEQIEALVKPYVEKARKAKLEEARIANSKLMTEELYFSVLSDGTRSMEEIAARPHYSSTRASMNDWVASGAQLLVGDGGDSSYIFMGAVNANVIDVSKPIWYFDRKFTVQLARELVGFEHRMFFSPARFKKLSVTSQKLFSGRVFNARHIDAVIQKTSREELVGTLLNGIRHCDATFTRVAPYVKSGSLTEQAFRAFGPIKQRYAATEELNAALAELERRGEATEIKLLLKLGELFANNREEKSDFKRAAEILRVYYSGDDESLSDSPIFKAAMAIILEGFEQQLS